MKSLNFLAHWGIDKEKAWSGTNYSIFKALEKHFSVKERPLKEKSIVEKIIDKIFPGFNPMGMGNILINRTLLGG